MSLRLLMEKVNGILIDIRTILEDTYTRLGDIFTDTSAIAVDTTAISNATVGINTKTHHWTPVSDDDDITVDGVANYLPIVGYVGVISDAVATFELKIGAVSVWKKKLPANTPDGQFFGNGITTNEVDEDITLTCDAGNYLLNLGYTQLSVSP
jgi:hypothetical protein